MATTRLLPKHTGTGKTILASICDSLEYGKNPNKTRDGKLISAFECDPRTAADEFLLAKAQYTSITGKSQRKRNDVLLYQIRQSFRPGEITPEEANRVGYELALRWTKGHHAFIVCTHEDQEHIHTHIYYNSTALNCERKFKDFFRSGRALRLVSDKLCLENGLSIVETPKPGRSHYGTWLGKNRLVSWQAKLRIAIDAVLAEKPADFETFLRRMEKNGYVVKRGKRVTFLAPGQKKPTGLRSLKGDYSDDAIRERISGERVVEPREVSVQSMSSTEHPKVNLLIDLQSRINAHKGPGFEMWAKKQNLKQIAKTFNYLDEHGLLEYAKLEELAASTTSAFNDLSSNIKTLESRMTEISELQKHISNYSRTREVYTDYRKVGYSKKFYAEHEGQIILHKASKAAFDTLGLKKLPTIKALQQEYATLSAEKKKLYSSYRQTRENMQEILSVKANTDQLLRIPPAEQNYENTVPRR